MINMIKRDARLVPYLRTEIEDSGLCVEISEDLSESDYVAIKVDDFYSGTMPWHEPKAVDYVVVVDCQCDSFFMYILELKNVKSPKFLNFSDIQEKFGNTIQDFLSDRFSDIFLNDRFKYKGIKLYLVSDAYNTKGRFSTHEEYRKFREKINKRDTLSVDFRLSSKLYRINGVVCQIEYEIPPYPIIRKWTQ